MLIKNNNNVIIQYNSDISIIILTVNDVIDWQRMIGLSLKLMNSLREIIEREIVLVHWWIGRESSDRSDGNVNHGARLWWIGRESSDRSDGNVNHGARLLSNEKNEMDNGFMMNVCLYVFMYSCDWLHDV